jgi:hypothetical protein
MRGNVHVRFGRRLGETDRLKSRNRAPGRPYPSIQARSRIARTRPAAPDRGQLVEHEYERDGAPCYLAAWDVRRAKFHDGCAEKDGILPFDALIDQFLSTEPYRSAPRVFVIADNGSAHRGKRSIDRLQGTWSNLTLVHTPVHASWLNQAEIYFSVVQRKALQPNDFPDLQALEQRFLAFGRRYEKIAEPFHGSSPAATSTTCTTARSSTWSSAPPDRRILQATQTSKNFRPSGTHRVAAWFIRRILRMGPLSPRLLLAPHPRDCPHSALRLTIHQRRKRRA